MRIPCLLAGGMASQGYAVYAEGLHFHWLCIGIPVTTPVVFKEVSLSIQMHVHIHNVLYMIKTQIHVLEKVKQHKPSLKVVTHAVAALDGL